VRHYIKANRMSTPLGFGQFRKQNEPGTSAVNQGTVVLPGPPSAEPHSP
jgi:hypothetical protein